MYINSLRWKICVRSSQFRGQLYRICLSQILKLNQAKIMIHEHNQTISEISDILGFTSIHYFSRKFKLQYGISPTDYAKSISQ